jgi:hypothetical protein
VILLGLLLIVVAVGAGVWLVLGSQSLTTPVDLHTAGYHVGVTPLALLITGAVVLLVFWLGLALIRGSVQRRRRPQREAKEAQRQAEIEENIRADERARAEEMHQNAIAERDRVRDEEEQARQTHGEQVRDQEERTRLTEAELAIRADERAKVEKEFDARAAAGGSASALGAGAGGETGGFGPTSGGVVPSAADPASAEPALTDSGDQVGRHAADYTAPDADASTADAPTPDASNADAPSPDAQHPDASTSPDAEHHRTVADKIMGRGPTGTA